MPVVTLKASALNQPEAAGREETYASYGARCLLVMPQLGHALDKRPT